MNIHKSARLTRRRREELVTRREAGEPLKRLARGFDISVPTARKWWGRYRAEGWAGLADRSSRPHASSARPAAPLQLAAKVLRWQHWTGARIGTALGISGATATRILRRCGLNRRGRLEVPPVVERYEHAAVGDLLHLDTKKLGRITYLGHRATGQRRGQRHGSGWEIVHVAVDAHSRVAYVELLPDEHSDTARGFVRHAVGWFRGRGVRVRRVLMDSGSCYRSWGFRATCRALRLAHHRTRPYTPRTNGKAEHFIQTLWREWAYARPYYTSADRTRILPGWLEHYNCARPHASLDGQPPMSRFPGRNNLMLVHS